MNNVPERQPSTAPDTSTPARREPRLTRIATRAHEIYEARGGQHGRDLDDWLQAEREIDAEPEHDPQVSE
jgi:hypothetical protein